MFRNRQRGVGLVAAVFLLLVIGALIAFLVRMSGPQHSMYRVHVRFSRREPALNGACTACCVTTAVLHPRRLVWGRIFPISPSLSNASTRHTRKSMRP